MKGTYGAPVPSALDLELYSRMALIRRFEEAAYRAYERGEIAGSIHASIGQEAVAVGVISALAPRDTVFSHHRGHGHALAKGVDPGRLMAELFGRSTGVCRGKGGSMHVTDVSCGFLGSLAVVGSSIPLAVGAALRSHLGGSDDVCAVFFGDGAINQGVLYESLNLAAIWDLPTLFVCENNGYAVSVRSTYATAGSGLVARAQAFGLTAEQVDGQHVGAVRAAAERVAAVARTSGPALLECHTYRFMGHSRGDPPHGLYRSAKEVMDWGERDPLAVHVRAAAIPEDVVRRLDDEAAGRIAAAVELAYAAPPPDANEALEDVWGP
jgi:TPP-dependent pyruvate/acetoin dehydrogenase alpha subunit